MRSFVVGMALLGSLAACDSTTANSNTSLTALARHQAQWDHRSFHSYSFDYQRAGIGTANVHVVVTADVVTSVIDATTGQPPIVAVDAPTIDSLFATARTFYDDDVTLELEFDSQFGYPTRVFATGNNPGGGYEVQVSNLQPIE